MGGKEKEREREHWCENVDFEIWVEMINALLGGHILYLDTSLALALLEDTATRQ